MHYHSGYLWMNTFLHPRSNSREIKIMFGKVGNLGVFKCNKKLMTSPFYEGQSFFKLLNCAGQAYSSTRSTNSSGRSWNTPEKGCPTAMACWRK